MNCCIYNIEGSAIYAQAKEMEKFLYEEVLHERLPEKNAQLISAVNDGGRKLLASIPNPKACKIPQDLLAKARMVLTKVTSQPKSYLFNAPVDPVRDGAIGYFDVVKNPMDFGTIRIKLDTNDYESIKDFEKDMDLVFSNCFLYNTNTHTVVYQVFYKLDYLNYKGW